MDFFHTERCWRMFPYVFCGATGLYLSWAFLLMCEYSYFKVTSVNWVSRFLSEFSPG